MSTKIFLIDDEPISNMVNKIILKKIFPSLDVTDFTNPVNAFSNLVNEQPELIFLDLNMPEMTGWDFLDRMQKEGISIKVIVLTSSVSALDRNKAREYKNVVDFFNKPPDKEMFQKHLN